MTTQRKIIAIVPAAGSGSRMLQDKPKQYLLLNGKTILQHTLDVLLSYAPIEKVIVAVAKDDPYIAQLALDQSPRIQFVVGGATRAESVFSALQSAVESDDGESWVLVHDAARPCLTHQDLDKLLQIDDPNGAILAYPAIDTIKRADGQQRIQATEDRSQLWHALTPQFFPTERLCAAYKSAIAQNLTLTDEASAMELAGFRPHLVPGRSDNLKITRPEDLALAAFYLQRREFTTERTEMIRIGHGFDVHAFGGVGPIIIGGVAIPYEKGLLAHSDGDVALHALTDALLGAVALGDIGKLFPDTDMAYKGADSRGLLREAYRQVRSKGYRVGNVDVTIIAQAPKMRPHIDAMRACIAEDLACEIGQVNVKATTSEKLGFTGRGEGIACEAVALLFKDN